ncbi:MAG: hypothetical protein R8M11_02490 [Gallionella sp.]
MKITYFLILVAILISGCSSYQQKGTIFNQSGFSEERMGNNVFRITYEGNDKNSDEEVSDFNLLRSAEVTLENGFKYFVILKTTDNSSDESFGSTPSLSSTSAGLKKLHTATSTIICSEEYSDISHGQLYDAASTVETIKQKYRL